MRIALKLWELMISSFSFFYQVKILPKKIRGIMIHQIRVTLN